ncbi:acetyl-CoA carboxylase biotin carboxyl carrier protein subunit [uncultured Rikenella sp.]|uniref:acetyl-CoA carboxylase biotin carboxyl carrier protein subunit n=1 Tax=uncultured Rikenella sp. TaxID=368003 RepID=UPI00272BCD69|nr:acetyl-CoA carboxylase biotin carboxyl carrier protein subunit [uncultured Rikenella sp.]
MNKTESAVQLEMLATENGSYPTTLTAKYKNREPWAAKDLRRIVSFIPGTITTVDVKVGDRVKEGDVLLTFKAMKMHNTYRSPIGGTVARVHVAAGDVVAKGVLLLEFE